MPNDSAQAAPQIDREVMRDAARYRNKRHRAWLRDKPHAHWSEVEWKQAYDSVCDQQIEDDAQEKPNA